MSAGSVGDAGRVLAGRRILVTGVLTDQSFAYHTAVRLQEQGAELVLTGHGRSRRLTERAARMLPRPPEVLELDVLEPGDHAALADDLGERWGALDGVLHSVAYAPPDVWEAPFFEVPHKSLDLAMRASVYSLQSLVGALRPLLTVNPDVSPSVLGLTTIPGRLTAHYAWMGVVKAALDTLVKQMAIQLGGDGVRVNLLAPGPVRTNAGRGVPGIDAIAGEYEARAPLGWNSRNVAVAADAACFMLSASSRWITGEVLDIDGGMHVVL